jgi:hypothetical protein
LECEAEERSLPPLGLLVDDPVDVSKAVHIKDFLSGALSKAGLLSAKR